MPELYAEPPGLASSRLLHAPIKRRDVEVVAVRAPRRQSEIRKALGVRRGLESQRAGPTHSRMLAVPAAARPRRKARHDHVRPHVADDSYHVAQEPFLAPDAQRLFGRLGVAEVHHARECLLAAIDPARLQQFVGADDAHQLALFGPDQVLPAFPARRGKVDGTQVTAASEVRQHSSVLVVRVRAKH